MNISGLRKVDSYYLSSTVGKDSPGRWLKSYRQISVMYGGLAFMLMGPVHVARASSSISTTISSHLLKRSCKVDQADNLVSARMLSRITHPKTHPSVMDVLVSNLLRGGDGGESSHSPLGHDNNNNYQDQHNYNAVNGNINSYGQSSALEANKGMIPPSQVSQQEQAYEQPYADESGVYPGGYNSNEQLYHGQRESVEDRLAAWRSQQQVCLYDYGFSVTSVHFFNSRHTYCGHQFPCTNSKYKNLYPQNRQHPP